MADFYTNLSGTAEVNDSVKLAFVTAAIIAYGQNNVTDQFAQFKQSINAVSISLPRYDRLTPSTTPLNEREDVAGKALVDSKRVFTPAEFGEVVTKTELASLQTGGTIDMAIPQVLGLHSGATTDSLALAALGTTSNAISIGTGAAGALQATDVMSRSVLDKAYNKLARANVPKIGGAYIAIMHADQINDLLADVQPGSWVDVSKYSQPDKAFANEIGMFKGFRIIQDNFITVVKTGSVSHYTAIFMGFNGLGKVESLPLTFTATGPFDRLGRFVNMGWKWVGTYGIVEPTAVWKCDTASSVGDNS